jgi:excisionase family DNA binding protein
VVRGLGKHSEVVLEPLLLRPIEVAQLLGIGRSRAYELIAAGDIPGVMRVGRSVRVSLVACAPGSTSRRRHPLSTPHPRLWRWGSNVAAPTRLVKRRLRPWRSRSDGRRQPRRRQRRNRVGHAS